VEEAAAYQWRGVRRWSAERAMRVELTMLRSTMSCQNKSWAKPCMSAMWIAAGQGTAAASCNTTPNCHELPQLAPAASLESLLLYNAHYFDCEAYLHLGYSHHAYTITRHWLLTPPPWLQAHP
jgi:hypothetical protein